MTDYDSDLDLKHVDPVLEAKIYKSKFEKAQFLVEEMTVRQRNDECREQDLLVENVDLKNRLKSLSPLFSSEKESKKLSSTSIEKIKKHLKVAREDATYYSAQVDKLKQTNEHLIKDSKDRERVLEKEVTYHQSRVTSVLNDLGEDDESHKLRVQLDDARKVKDRLVGEKEQLSEKVAMLRTKMFDFESTIDDLRTQLEQSSRKGTKDELFGWKGEESDNVEERLLTEGHRKKCTRMWNTIRKCIPSSCCCRPKKNIHSISNFI